MAALPPERLRELGLGEDLNTAVEDLYYSSKAIQWAPLEEPASLSYAAALNHSNDPSLELSYDDSAQVWKYCVLRPVVAGDELSLDYRTLVATFGDDGPLSTACLKFTDPEAYFALGPPCRGGE